MTDRTLSTILAFLVTWALILIAWMTFFLVRMHDHMDYHCYSWHEVIWAQCEPARVQ